MPITASNPGLQKRVRGRTDVAEIARVDDDFDVVVVASDPLQNADGVVPRAVVDEDVLITVFAKLSHLRADAIIKLFDVALFVVAGR
jgi:hypothetical protein